MKIKLLIIPLLLVFTVSIASAQTPTGIEEDLREKVQEKLKIASNVPTSYIGTVTDISEGNLQIDKYSLAKQDGDSGEIEQVSTDSETTYINFGTNSKTIKFDDIAIGDFVVAMGYKNGNDVLTSKRILVIEPLSPSTRKSFLLTVNEANTTSIDTVNTKGEPLSIKPAKNIKVYESVEGEISTIKVQNLESGDKIISVGSDVNGIFEARTIRLISSGSSETEE